MGRGEAPLQPQDGGCVIEVDSGTAVVGRYTARTLPVTAGDKIERLAQQKTSLADRTGM